MRSAMHRAHLCWLIASGCVGVDVASVPLRVEPPTIDLIAELGQPPPVATWRVFAAQDDVTAAASYSLDGGDLGALAGAQLTSDGLTGGTATLHVALPLGAIDVPVTVHVRGRRVIDGAPAGAAAAFPTAAPSPVAAHLDPADGAVLPQDLGRLVVSFAADPGDDAHQLAITAPFLQLVIVAPGAPGPRAVELSAAEWTAVTRTARAGTVDLEVASLRSGAPATARVARATLEIADLDASALLVGATFDGSTAPPALWRYDVRGGRAAPMFANPGGACLGCHLAVSADGARIAAVQSRPGVASLGVMLDPTGRVVAQADPAATPWATGAFDPGGGLVGAWQGHLALRDAATGAVRAALDLPDAAAAPSISPDGSRLAYATLDDGFGAAASQPVGHAIRVRPWSAARAAVGAPVELARAPGRGVLLPSFSPDGRWIAYGHAAIDPDRINQRPLGSAAVRADGSGAIVELTADPLDRLARWASPIAPARAGRRPAEPMVWVAIVSARPVGGNPTSLQQLWLAAFFPERGVVAPAFHLPGQPPGLVALHGPAMLP